MKVLSLQSGSNGNCFYVETGQVRLLFDAGISARVAEQRLRSHGREMAGIDALFITHDHSDHSRSMGVFQRKFGLPIYVTRKTLAAVNRNCRPGQMDRVRFFRAGETCQIGDVAVHSIPTPHDSVDGVAFVVEDGQHRVGILTDLGHVFTGLKEVLTSLDGVVIESNYDEAMLDTGPYPYYLKRRIRGDGGHISNTEAAQLLSQCKSHRLKWACLCHLSEENNCPEVALRTHQHWLGDDVCLYVADRHQSVELADLD